MPSTFSYELVLKGKGRKGNAKADTNTDLEGNPLKVPDGYGLTGEEFLAARKRICRLACLARDQRDHSKRQRLFPPEAGGTAA